MSHPNEHSSLLKFSGETYNNQGNIQAEGTHLLDHSASATIRVQVDSHGDPGLPIPRAVFVVTNAALGAGMLAFPEAYGKTGGVPQALAVQAVSIVP